MGKTPDPVKECCRLIRLARGQWEAHNNASARRERGRAMQLYLTLTPEQKDRIPQVLRQWLRYRSTFYLSQPKRKRRNAPNPVPPRAGKSSPTPSRESR